MRRPRRCRCPVPGVLALMAGVALLLVLVLPPWIWWILCIGLLIYGGICIFRF